MRRPGQSGGNVVLGLLQIAVGRGAGFTQFGTTGEAFLASLAPLLAFALVGGGLIAFSGQPHAGLALFLVALCELLAPPVIADIFCRVWQRGSAWARYATVLNWLQWLLGLLVALLLLGVEALGAAGVPVQAAVGAAVLLLTGYGLWLHWFLARHTLDLSRLRATLVVAAIMLGTGLAAQAPLLLARAVPVHIP